MTFSTENENVLSKMQALQFLLKILEGWKLYWEKIRQEDKKVIKHLVQAKKGVKKKYVSEELASK